MILQRDGREVDEATYVKTSDSMLRMQRVADRLISLTPEISKYLPGDSLLRTTKIQSIQAKNEAIGAAVNPRSLQKIRETTAGLPPMKAEMSSEDVRQRALDVDSILEEQKSENERLKEELEGKKDRYVLRELEYRKIIEDLQGEIREKAVLDINESKKMELTTKYHTEILDRVQRLQGKTSQVLVDQEKTVIRFFNDKIAEIKKQFEDERIKKGKKDQDYIQRENQLISELEWIENIAQKIDNENINLMKKFMDLQAQYQTQENDRDMLLKELIMKKKQNAILKGQIDNYEKMLNQVQKEEEEAQEYEREWNQQQQQQQQGSRSPQHEDNNNQRYMDDQQMYLSHSQSKNHDAASQQASQRPQSQQSNVSQNLRIRNTFKSTSWVMKKYTQQPLHQQKQQESRYMQTGLFGKTASQTMHEKLDPLAQNEKKIKSVQASLKEEQRRLRELKQLYVKELMGKCELESIIRKSVEDVKEEIIQLKGESRVVMQSSEPDWVREKREVMIDKLISNEKILTLIYDKTFYPDAKNIELQIQPDAADLQQLDPQMLAMRFAQKKQTQDQHNNQMKELDGQITHLQN